MRKDIEFLPAGWTWIPQGEETWITSTGQTSTARHGRRGNETLSTRQVQNYQREKRAAQGTPKAPSIPRQGKIRTIKGTGPRSNKLQTDITKSKKNPTGVGTLYNVERHGYSETYVFRTFDDAQQWALLNKVPAFAQKDGTAIIQIRFTDRLNTTSLVGSDTTGGPGYATLTTLDRANLFFGNIVNEDSRGSLTLPWGTARERIDNYDMSGKDARIYIYVMEK